MEDIRVKNFLYPYVRFLNASLSVDKADFFVGNTLASPSLGFGCFSGYVRVPAGLSEFKITVAGDKNNVADTITLPFKQGEVYTIALVHSDGKPMAYGIKEPTQRQNTDCGHIRVCHLAPAVGSADISANGHKILCGINYLELSKYMCITPAKYEFLAEDSDTGKTALVMPNQNVFPGKYNTIYLVGNGTEKTPLMGLFSVDAASYTGHYL